MALVAVTYAVGVLEGKSAGISVESGAARDVHGQLIPEHILPSLTRKELDRRIAGLMTSTEKVLRIYVAKQFETSGRALGTIAAQIGMTGGSESPWHPLTLRTLQARAKGHGYYGYAKGKNVLSKTQSQEVGEDEGAGWGMDPAEAMEMKETARREGVATPADVKPRLWTKRGMRICLSGIARTEKSVDVRITEMTVRFNEPTRPVFVLGEIFRLTQKLAELAFKNIRTRYNSKDDTFSKEAAVDPGSQPFSFRVGEKRPFERDKIGRPITGQGQPSRLLRGKRLEEMSKEAQAVKMREAVKSRLRKRRKFMDDILAGKLMLRDED